MAETELLQLTPAEFERISRFVYQRTGISLGEEKVSMLSNRLRRRLRALKLGTFEEYYQLLMSGDEEEMSHFLSAVTTNETYFFRNDKLWEYVGEQLIPALVEEKRGSEPSLRFWSAASSTGAEAYTLAIVLRETLGAVGGRNARIVASDISEKVLSVARAGRYDAYAVSRLSPERCKSYFRHDAANDTYELKPDVRSMVTFEFHNLRDAYRGAPFDVVFLRNVMMYFDLPMKRLVLKNVTAALRPGGYLIIGDVDPLRDGSGLRDDCDLEYVRPSVHRKPRDK
ncbi:MAG: protein-glutamate O-methyltransferase CheR [Phycisphaerae bacterium]